MNAYWNILPPHQGQIVERLYVQLAGAAEGISPRGYARIKARRDRSDGSWFISGPSPAEIRNCRPGDPMPSPASAKRQLEEIGGSHA